MGDSLFTPLRSQKWYRGCLPSPNRINIQRRPGGMNENSIAEMAMEKLKRGTGMVEKAIPAEIQALDAEFPPGRKIHWKASLYQAEHLKIMSFHRFQLGDNHDGTAIFLIPNDERYLPFVLGNVSFRYGPETKIFTEFTLEPMAKDEKSLAESSEPFRKWREELEKLPSEKIPGYPEVDEFIRTNLSKLHYMRLVPYAYRGELLSLTDRFFDIYLDVYRKASPLMDSETIKSREAFRAMWNQSLREKDASGILIIKAFGQERAQLFSESLSSL